MEKQVLSIEEMQELIELGIDTSKASMEWISPLTNWMGNPVENSKYYLQIKGEGIAVMGDETFDIIPTFTLQDILKLLPKHSWSLDSSGIVYKITQTVLQHFLNENPIDAAFEMLKWCIKNKYI